MMAEILGRETGYCRGKGGSMHLTAMQHGMLGADGVVGGMLSVAVGAAHGLTLLGRDDVVIAFFGDGAANEGAFHESLNLAAVLDAPVVFVCENNQWALSTPVHATMRITDIADRAAGYGIPGYTVDGNDILDVRTTVDDAVTRARSGSGPTLVEAKSYRITLHSLYSSKGQDTRPDDELEAWRLRDPLALFSSYLTSEMGLSASRLESLAEAVTAEVDDAVCFAQSSASPPASQAVEDVYAPSDWLTPGRLS
jgi:pyruvate dehydrogenase E1 component alpha subunit